MYLKSKSILETQMYNNMHIVCKIMLLRLSREKTKSNNYSIYIYISKIDLEFSYLQGIILKNWSVSQAVWSVLIIYFGLKRFYA